MLLVHACPLMVQLFQSFLSLVKGGSMTLLMSFLQQIHPVPLNSGGRSRSPPFVVVNSVYDLEEGVVVSDVGFLVGCLSAGVIFFGCLSGSLENLVVVKLLLHNF